MVIHYFSLDILEGAQFPAQIAFVDQTIRDAQQSIWLSNFYRYHTPSLLPVIDQAGYKYIATACAP